MIPVAVQAWIGVAIGGCVAGIHAMRAEFRAVRVPKLPAKYRRPRARHRKPWWHRLSTMERWTLAIQRAQEQADIYVEPDWYDELRTRGFRPPDELRPEVLEGPTTQEFRRLVGASVWGTPVDVDEWVPVEPVLVVTR